MTKKWIVLLIIILIPLSIWWGSTDRTVVRHIQPKNFPQKYIGIDMTATTYNFQKQEKYIIKSPHVTFLPAKKMTEFVTPTIFFYNLGQQNWSLHYVLSALQGNLTNKNLITLQKNVVLINKINNLYLKKLTTNHLLLNTDTNIIKSVNSSVVISSRDFNSTGNYLVADLNQKSITLQGKVSSVYKN